MQVLIKDSLANLLGFCEKFPLKTFENSFSSLPLFLCLCHQQWLTCIPSSSNFRNWPDCQAPSSPLLSCISLFPSCSCYSLDQQNPGEALGQRLWRGAHGAMYGVEAGPASWGVKLRCAWNTWSQEKNTLTARIGSWPLWCRTGPKISTTYCWREIGFRYLQADFCSPGAKITTDVNYSGLEIFFFLQEIGFFAAIKPELSIHNLLLSMLQMACWCHEHLCTSYLGARSKTDFSSLCVQLFACLSKYRMFMSQVLRELKQNVSLQVNKWKWLSNRHWWKQWKQV